MSRPRETGHVVGHSWSADSRAVPLARLSIALSHAGFAVAAVAVRTNRSASPSGTSIHVSPSLMWRSNVPELDGAITRPVRGLTQVVYAVGFSMVTSELIYGFAWCSGAIVHCHSLRQTERPPEARMYI